MSDKRICKYCGMELSEDVPHGLRECHLHAVNRIAELEAVIEILEDQQREATNILIDKNLHIDSLYEEGYKLQLHIAKLELIANELFEALTLTYSKLPEHWRKDYCPYDYHSLKVKLERAKERDEIIDTLFYDIYRLQSRVAELEAERRWIPVSERLPEENKCVLVYDAGGNMTVDFLVTSAEVEKYFWLAEYRILFWMPLPESPIMYGKESE